MKRYLVALLALCVLALAGCAKENTPEPAPAPEPPPVEVPPAPEPPPEPTPEPEPTETVYTVGGVAFPVPREYDGLLTVETELEAWNEHWQPLVSFAEKESVEAGQRKHPGEDWGDGQLCTVMRLDRIGFEDWASNDSTGSRIFARDGEDAYYLLAQPTDVRLCRDGEEPDAAAQAQWSALNAWAETLPEEIIARNGLTAYDAAELFYREYIYDGEHMELGCRFPGQPMDLIILSLSQPARRGEGGVWCVERIHYVYSDYDWTDSQLVFPAGFGVDESAADYYARLQAECDAGEHPELLTPVGAALDYARRSSWRFGEDISESDFEPIHALG